MRSARQDEVSEAATYLRFQREKKDFLFAVSAIVEWTSSYSVTAAYWYAALAFGNKLGAIGLLIVCVIFRWWTDCVRIPTNFWQQKDEESAASVLLRVVSFRKLLMETCLSLPLQCSEVRKKCRCAGWNGVFLLQKQSFVTAPFVSSVW